MTETSPWKSRSIGIWVWNPFTLIAGGPALADGIGIILLAGALCAPTRTHFDGVLDTHIGFDAPFWIFPAQGIINWICLAATLWIAGLLCPLQSRLPPAVKRQG